MDTALSTAKYAGFDTDEKYKLKVFYLTLYW
jgi:hypothetical protein